jgi:FkbM family methyltransferase
MHPSCWRALCFWVVPGIEHRAVLAGLDFDAILDVGANRSQFSLVSRLVKSDIPIIAFEPVPTEARIFRKVFSGTSILLHQVALGEKAGEADIHLTRHADGSSLLPSGEIQGKLFPISDEIGTLKVSVRRLDDFKFEWEKYSRILLKIDVQGYESSVLKGATETLRQCAYVYVECSEIELYVGQALYPEIADFLEQHSFKLQSRQNETLVDGKLIQADYLFARISNEQ